VPAAGIPGYILGIVAALLTVFLLGNRQFPPAPFVILFGVISAVFSGGNLNILIEAAGFRLPQIHVPTLEDIWTGFLLLALPQIPLSLGNSILATRQVVSDLFPHRPISVRRISLTYSLMNLVGPF
jgi:hypothetical protein